jgi:hypothetical protein
MAKSTVKSGAEAVATARGSSLALVKPEQARENLHLLLLANPNYFGNLTDSPFKPILNVVADSNYETLGCVGYSASLKRLEAVVGINQVGGYNGGLCTNGSQEYVRFYLSFDNGASWQDQGVTSFTVHDLPGPKPLEYSVALPVSIPEHLCFFPNLPKVRAILSWNYEPPANTPGYVPVWGGVANTTIQIPGTHFIIFKDLLAEAKLKLPESLNALVDVGQPLATKPPQELSLLELIATYRGKPVQPHRLFYPQVAKLANGQALTASLTAKHPFAKLGIDLGEVIGNILATNGDTAFEQLDCVGLDPNRSALAAVVRVKTPYGFNGAPCTTGSTEYVAFWVDWGAGFEYAGTTTINTHDIAGIPAGGLDYAVGLPVDLASHMQPCVDGPKTAVVRAILSWEAAPPPTNPNYVPVWGNRVDALVQIPAGDTFVVGTPDIAIIGGIGVASIDTTGVTAEPGCTLPNALFALTGTYADPWVSGRQCPFGGQVVIQGAPSVGSKYRVWVRKVGSPGQTLLSDPILTTDWLGNGTWRNPDASGFFTYLDSSQNIDDVLAYWYSSGDDLWQVWLEIADIADTVFGSTPAYLIQLDNSAPTAEIHIDSGGDCKQFGLGTMIDGHFVARDIHFGAFSLDTTPASLIPPPNEPATATPSTSQTAVSPGDVWTLNTDGVVPCGYVVQLWVYDNTIVGSGPGSHNSAYADVGFCLIDND